MANVVGRGTNQLQLAELRLVAYCLDIILWDMGITLAKNRHDTI
jgi:hypothetical protein